MGTIITRTITADGKLYNRGHSSSTQIVLVSQLLLFLHSYLPSSDSVLIPPPNTFCASRLTQLRTADQVLSIPGQVTRSLRWQHKRHFDKSHSSLIWSTPRTGPDPFLLYSLSPTPWRTGQLTAQRVQSPKCSVSDSPIPICPGHTGRRLWQRPPKFNAGLAMPQSCLEASGLIHSQRARACMPIYTSTNQTSTLQVAEFSCPQTHLDPSDHLHLAGGPFILIILCLGADPTARNLFDHTLTSRTWRRHRNPAVRRP